MVSAVTDDLADGATAKRILRQHPDLSEDDIRAALSYAAHLVRKEERRRSRSVTRRRPPRGMRPMLEP